MDSQTYGNKIVTYNDEQWYYCGEWSGEMDYDAVREEYAPNGNNGENGDVRVRPIHLGPGEYTCTVGPMAPYGDVQWAEEE